MKNCVFCKIAKKEILADIIAEEDNFIAFLDNMPTNPGHTLVIPKKHYRWVWDVERFGDYAKFSRKIAKALQKATGREWIVMGVAGNEIPHAHIHLVPRYEGDGHGGFIKTDIRRELSKSEMNGIAKKIRSFL